SNFAWLQKRSYNAIKASQPGVASVVISGGLFGSDIGGAALALVGPGGASQTITKNSGSGAARAAPGGACTRRVPSGADYPCNTYRMGQQKAGWSAGAYPLDGIGQHLYIDQGGLTSGSKITRYLQDVRNAYVAFEGTKTAKKTEITEFGWVANPSDAGYAAVA